MSSSLFWLLGLAALLLMAVLRFVRPRSSWTTFRAGARARAEQTRRETERATEALTDTEALLPLRAVLRDMTPPPGVRLRELEAGPEEVRVLVTSARASLILRLVHSSCRRTGRSPASPAGVWLLTVRDAETLTENARDAEDDAFRPRAVCPEEVFADLAACAARLETLVADPASARRSIHAPSD